MEVYNFMAIFGMIGTALFTTRTYRMAHFEKHSPAVFFVESDGNPEKERKKFTVTLITNAAGAIGCSVILGWTGFFIWLATWFALSSIGKMQAVNCLKEMEYDRQKEELEQFKRIAFNQEKERNRH